MLNEITAGIDELGVCCGHKKNAYWYGSQLSIEEARLLGAVQQRNQPAGHRFGAVGHDLGDGEPRSRDRRAGRDGLPASAGDLHAVPRNVDRRVHRLDPLYQRAELFAEDLDTSDPCSSKNVRVV